MQALTYLAMELSLYLASAALIGVVLGWCIWGLNRQRHAAKIKEKMQVAIDAEKSVVADMRLELDELKAKLTKDLETERANSAKAQAKVRQLLEAEKEATHAARSEVTKLRQEMDEVIAAEKMSAANAIQDAMRDAESLTEAARTAKYRETQAKAELEEARLMAGADKLAAESVRNELEKLKQQSQQALEFERTKSSQAKDALDAIQATLAQTFGSVAFETTENSSATAATTGVAGALDADMPSHDGDIDHVIEPSSLNQSLENAETPTILDVPGDGIKDINPDQTKVTGDIAAVGLDEQRTIAGGDEIRTNGLDHDEGPSGGQAEPLLMSNGHGVTDNLSGTAPKPASLFDQAPDQIDDLKKIDGIDGAIEQALNEQGCYQFSQLASFDNDDVKWLCQAVAGHLPDLKARMTDGGWIDKARDLQGDEQIALQSERPRWWNRRRLP